MSGAEVLPDALRDRTAYPWPVDDVEFVETHISWVYLAGDRVVKVKRPVRFSFVDYSTLALRRQACEDEVRLNRLLADDIYLGVVPIVRTGDGVHVAGEGEVVDWATLMRRIDGREMLDSRLASGRVPADLASRLADRLVPFHLETAPRCDGPDEDVLADQEEVLRENLEDLAPFAGNPLPKLELRLVRTAIERFLEECRVEMLNRVAGGWIREGHGDLRCEHVVVPDEGPVHVYDCVEFSRELRCADVASDIAFLLMDLVRLDAPSGTIDELLRRYRQAGAELPPGMLRLYWIHRALVRTKVHCLQLNQPDPEQRSRSARKAVEYLHMAARQAISTRPALIVMTGLSGTGKSTVAASIARMLGVARHASDKIRKELAANEREPGDIYTGAWTERTYRELLRRGEDDLAVGRMAILDATFLDETRRAEVSAIASRHGVPLVLIETVTDEDVVECRLVERARRGDSISDATVGIYREQRQRQKANPPAIPAGAIHAIVDTSPDGPVSLDPVLSALRDNGVIEARIDDMTTMDTKSG